jgi:hypothetical protein
MAPRSKERARTKGMSAENNKNAANTTGGYKAKKFMGGNTSLQGKVFEITTKDAVHQYAETLKAVADYVGQEYTHGGNIRYMIENMQDYNFIRPADHPDNANQCISNSANWNTIAWDSCRSSENLCSKVMIDNTNTRQKIKLSGHTTR